MHQGSGVTNSKVRERPTHTPGHRSAASRGIDETTRAVESARPGGTAAGADERQTAALAARESPSAVYARY